MTQPPAARTLEELTESFFALGSVILSGPEEFEIFMLHVRRNNIPTQTGVDREAGTVTIFKRDWGTMEV